MSIPAPWAPMEIKGMYEASGPDIPPLLTRLSSDPRMEAVWHATTVERTPKRPNFPLRVYGELFLLLSYPVPEKPTSEVKEKHRRIADSARKLIEEMQDSLLDPECASFIMETLMALEEFAKGIESEVETAFFPYRSENFPKFKTIKNPKKSLAARAIYEIFMYEFETPLWGHIAALVEVALDLPQNTLDYQKARNIVLKK